MTFYDANELSIHWIKYIDGKYRRMEAAAANEIGEKIGQNLSVKYLATDFKKRGGYQRSIELSHEYNLYRQNYCGCAFSKNLIPNG